MFTKIFQSSKALPDQDILSPLLSSIQFLGKELSNEGSISTFTMGELIYHFQHFNDFIVVFVTDSENSVRDYMNKIGWKFMHKYGEILVDFNDDISKFEEFDNNIDKIVENNFELVFKLDTSQSIDPRKQLDTKSLFYIDKKLKNTAIAMTSLKKSTIEEVARETGEDFDTTSQNLEALLEMGYLGRQKIENTIYYFY